MLLFTIALLLSYYPPKRDSIDPGDVFLLGFFEAFIEVGFIITLISNLAKNV